jgi:hypothetical protein
MEKAIQFMQPYPPVGIIGLGLLGTAALPGRQIEAKVPSIEAIRRLPFASEVIR